MKGQILVDFLVEHPGPDIIPENFRGIKVRFMSVSPWVLQFDGSSTEESIGAGRKLIFLSSWTLNVGKLIFLSSWTLNVVIIRLGVRP